MAWYYVANGASQGPVTEPELRRLQEQNVIALDTPVWTEGMAEWTPLQNTALAAPVAAGLAPVATHACAECGRSFPEDEMLQYENSWVCAACKPVFFQRIKEGVTPVGTLNYASVGRRFAAILIDGLILVFLIFVPALILLVALGAATRNDPSASVWFMPIILILEYGLPAAFEIFFIGRYGATPGKMLMKIKVVTPEGGPITYGRSAGRYFAKLLSNIILWIGFLMAFWDEEKRTLHDRICKTRVISTQ
ncbi:MAG: RDD family protein [Verrucomicrobiota bacterium]